MIRYLSFLLVKTQYYYAVEINNLERGINKVAFRIVDGQGHSEEVELVINRKRVFLPNGLKDIENWPNTAYIANGNDLLTNITKTNRLTDDYIPQNLVDLNSEYYLYTNAEGILLREDAAENLRDMLFDLKEETGKNIVIASGYRSISEQFDVYIGWLAKLGQTEADKISARPGYSQHHLGTVVDFISEETNFEFSNSFDDTISGKWLLENSHKYGYIQTYPKGLEIITDYAYEAWQYRYIGIDLSQELKSENKSLQEYLNNLGTEIDNE